MTNVFLPILLDVLNRLGGLIYLSCISYGSSMIGILIEVRDGRNGNGDQLRDRNGKRSSSIVSTEGGAPSSWTIGFNFEARDKLHNKLSV